MNNTKEELKIKKRREKNKHLIASMLTKASLSLPASRIHKGRYPSVAIQTISGGNKKRVPQKFIMCPHAD